MITSKDEYGPYIVSNNDRQFFPTHDTIYLMWIVEMSNILVYIYIYIYTYTSTSI